MSYEEYIETQPTSQDATMAALHSNYRRNVHCDICSATAIGTQSELQANGWELGNGYELCGGHD